MRRRELIWTGLAAGAALVAGGSVVQAFDADLDRARQRLSALDAEVFESRFGAMEYAIAGEGPPCLMIHGTGGGVDQALAFAEPLRRVGHRVIAPSRFGYLRSANPSDPTPQSQALAFVDLLDRLGIERAAILGGSAGVLSALAFAIDHPMRCSGLVALVPATYAPGRETAPPGPVARFIMDHGLRSDFLYWAGAKANEDEMIAALLATDPSLVHQASANERARVRGILWDMLPVSARSAGLANDMAQTLSPAPMAIESITAPTLAISLEDDRFGTAAAARHIARSVPGARLLIYPSGGHVWVGRDAEVWREIDAFLNQVQSA